jgi:hypothetical protein
MTPERLKIFCDLINAEGDLARSERQWSVIELWHREAERVGAAKARTPNIKDAKRRLTVIQNSARKLAASLRSEPLFNLLLSGGEMPGSIDSVGRLTAGTEEEWRIFEQGPDDFLKMINLISNTANEYLEDDVFLRHDLFLPSAEASTTGSIALILWPGLFDIWTRAGNHLAYTPDGPTHRFLNFVHEEFAIEPPLASAVRAAVERHIARRGQK